MSAFGAAHPEEGTSCRLPAQPAAAGGRPGKLNCVRKGIGTTGCSLEEPESKLQLYSKLGGSARGSRAREDVRGEPRTLTTRSLQAARFTKPRINRQFDESAFFTKAATYDQ